ncbi:unnamed protein product [Rhizophagus irregularis]|nr:unnamed protein product [Rhizophagus irregularis]
MDDEAIEDSDEEYESEDETTQEQLYCHTQFITQKEAQKIEDGLRGTALIENDYYYQYKETEIGKFHTGNLDEDQQQKFDEFIKKYNNLFAWSSNDFGRTSVVTHNIDTGGATPIKQRFYRTSHQNQLFIKEEIQRLLEAGLIVPSSSQWTSPVVKVACRN